VAFAEHSNIAIEAGYTVGIDAAEVRGGENVSGLDGVIFGDAEVKEDAGAEFAQSIDVKNLGLDGGHVGPFFGLTIVRKRHFADSTPERVCDFDFNVAQNHRSRTCWRQAKMRTSKSLVHARASWGTVNRAPTTAVTVL
jgi:hypothetical protein